MAKGGVNLDFDIKHPDEVRDAQKKDYTILKKRVTKEVIDGQEKAMNRIDKIAGRL